ncbi:MAG: CHAD domain-containing protein [Dehalococcoidia bacterium]
MSQDVTERELQFETHDLEAVDGWIRSQPRHAQLSFRSTGEKIQHDTYFDTTDWAIYRGGYSLRVRRRGEAAEATLKALGKAKNGFHSRREITQRLPDAAGAWETAGEVTTRVQAMTAGKPVRPLFEIVNRRRTVAIERDGVELAEISLDDAQILVDGTARRTFARVEIEESTAGGLEQAESFIEALREAGGLLPTDTSKFELGLVTAELQAGQGFDLGYVVLSPEASSGEYAYALLRKLFTAMLNHEPGTRLGEDPEELHDMRVATRRLRAAMSTFRDVLPARFERMRAELKWIAGCLGEVRDVEVQLEWLEAIQRQSGWEDATAVGPLIEERRERWSVERTRLLEALNSERYRALVDDLTAMLREGDEGQGAAAAPVRQYGRKVLRKRHRQFKREVSDLTPESDPHLYHLARIRAKKLRYAAEALTEVYGEPVTGLVTAIKAAQDLLGEHQDKAVAIGWLRQTALSDRAWPPLTLVRLGELAEGSRYRMAELRREWPETFAAVEKQWRQLRRATRKGGKPRESKKPVEEAPPSVAVQRPLSIFRRFFTRG